MESDIYPLRPEMAARYTESMVAGYRLPHGVSVAPHAGSARDQARVWRIEELAGLELLRASFVTQSFAPHAHDVFMIGVVEGGVAEVSFREARHVATTGSLLLLNPGEVYSAHPSGGTTWQYRGFYPNATLLRRIAAEVIGRERDLPELRAGVTHDAELVALLQRVHRALEEPASGLEYQSRLLHAFGQMILRHAGDRTALSPKGREHHAVRRARAYLEAHVCENVTLDVLAREAGVGPYYLIRVFHREVGLAPHAYQAQLRVKLAKTLLLAGMPPAQVAIEAGFYDQSHLTRHFRRCLGVTPGRYADSVTRRRGAR